MNKAVLRYFLNVKKNPNKLTKITYEKLKPQPYLSTQTINNKEKYLLFNLRSNCHTSKMNFRKINKKYLKFIFKCFHVKDQIN